LLVRMLLAPAIHVRGLRKSYEQVEAVRGVDLSVAPGDIVAFLGPNGAGKTTILEILEGHRQRDSGDVRVLGFDPEGSPRALRERMGRIARRDVEERFAPKIEALRFGCVLGSVRAESSRPVSSAIRRPHSA